MGTVSLGSASSVVKDENEDGDGDRDDKDTVGKIMDDARQWALESLRTDAQFLYTPPQIALSCILHFNQDLIRQFVSLKFPPGRQLSPATRAVTPVASTAGTTVPPATSPTVVPTVGKIADGDASERLLITIIQCDNLISKRLEIIKDRSKEYVTQIDKKLYQCKKVLDSLESSTSSVDTAKRKVSSPDEREVKKVKSE